MQRRKIYTMRLMRTNNSHSLNASGWEWQKAPPPFLTPPFTQTKFKLLRRFEVKKQSTHKIGRTNRHQNTARQQCTVSQKHTNTNTTINIWYPVDVSRTHSFQKLMAKLRTKQRTFKLFAAVIMISLNLGIPSVTFAPPCPARWNVFNVICVDGSPTDCAAIDPTVSPGAARHRMYFTHISISNASLIYPRDCRPSSSGSAPLAEVAHDSFFEEGDGGMAFPALEGTPPSEGGLLSMKAWRELWNFSLTHLHFCKTRIWNSG